MKISTEIRSISKKVGMEKAVELCAKAGFDAWDFTMVDLHRINWITGDVIPRFCRPNSASQLSFARKLKKIGEDHGIVCNQAHAPFPVNTRAVRDSLKLALECTAEAGAEICVIHPNNRFSAEQNAQFYFELIPFAKECGVKIATENMWNWDQENNISTFAACSTGEDFKKHIDAVADESFVACLDLGHAEMRGSGDGAVNMIKALGSRIRALHIHDNDLRNDLHQIPFSGSIDFEAILKALKEIGYCGYFTLESYAHLDLFSEENVFEGVVQLKNSARRLADLFDALC